MFGFLLDREFAPWGDCGRGFRKTRVYPDVGHCVYKTLRDDIRP
jgi:hypothetical protein